MIMGLKERWGGVCKEVAETCEKCGRNPEDVKIVAVSKTVGADVVGEGIALGMTDFGENREKPFNEKLALYPDANWHFIGTLQSNKAKQVVGKACLIHSLDRRFCMRSRRRRQSWASCKTSSWRSLFPARRARAASPPRTFPRSWRNSRRAPISAAVDS